MSQINRFAIKVFATEEGNSLPLAAFIPVFHRWIQTRALEGLWIDVADYSHVPQGPGVLLVGHEANLSIDETGGRRGLLVTRKQPLEGPLSRQLESVARQALEAAHRLETDPELPGALRFRADEIEVVLNDRFHAPNREETLAALRPEIESFLARLFGEQDLAMERNPDPRERLTVRVRATGAGVGVGSLLHRDAA